MKSVLFLQRYKPKRTASWISKISLPKSWTSDSSITFVLFKQKIFLLGQVGRKVLSPPAQSGAYAHKTLFHFKVISNCSSSYAHRIILRSAGHTLLHFLLGPETHGKGSLLAGSTARFPTPLLALSPAALSPDSSAGCLPVCPAHTGVPTCDLPWPSLSPSSLPGFSQQAHHLGMRHSESRGVWNRMQRW